MTTTKILRESEYEKFVQTTITGESGTITYTNRYIKVFHRDYKDGFIWRLA